MSNKNNFSSLQIKNDYIVSFTSTFGNGDFLTTYLFKRIYLYMYIYSHSYCTEVILLMLYFRTLVILNVFTVILERNFVLHVTCMLPIIERSLVRSKHENVQKWSVYSLNKVL